MNPTIGKYLMLAGIIILIAGAIVYFFGNKLGFLGRLPGDIRIEKGNSGFYFPIVTCILLSILITLIIRLVQWLNR